MFERRAKGRQAQAVLPHVVQQLNEMGGVQAWWNGLVRVFPRGGNPRDVLVGPHPGTTRVQCFDGEPSQVLDERQAQHARPRPEFADRQWRDTLVALEEKAELPAVKSAVAVSERLDSHGVDPWLSSVVPRSERWKLEVEGAGKVASDVPNVRGDEVEVVEQPLSGWGHKRSLPHVFRQRPIGDVQHPNVVPKPGEDVQGAMPR